MGYSKYAISFLEVLIKRNNDRIWMDIYYKWTDTYRFLSFSFNHPNYFKKNIPFHWHAVCAQFSETMKQKWNI